MNSYNSGPNYGALLGCFFCLVIFAVLIGVGVFLLINSRKKKALNASQLAGQNTQGFSGSGTPGQGQFTPSAPANYATQGFNPPATNSWPTPDNNANSQFGGAAAPGTHTNLPNPTPLQERDDRTVLLSNQAHPFPDSPNVQTQMFEAPPEPLSNFPTPTLPSNPVPANDEENRTMMFNMSAPDPLPLSADIPNPAPAPLNTCPSCGNQVKQGARFCPKCGGSLQSL